MKQALWLLGGTAAAFHAVEYLAGELVARDLGFCWIALMSALIALTFLWLWWERATPLALGMAVSWAGTASMMGWWWLQRPLERSDAASGDGLPLVFLSFQITGAMLHFEVMQTSMGYRRGAAAIPVLAAFAASVMVDHITKM
jgi:hypothetical protein